jgi:two-component system sensor histidine kinase/response regulator
VVDDRSESRRVVLSYLSDLGYAHNEEAASGEEALGKMKTAAAAGRPYGLCFIDMIMPQMDGWRLAAEINQDKLINGARLVLLVPQGMMGSEAKMTLLRWFNAYITKPVKRQDVQEAISATASAVIDLEASTEPDMAARSASAVKSSHGEGIGVLTLQRPLGMDSGEAEESTPPEDLSGRPLVLIVEDHPVNQKLFSMILEKLGYPSIIADDGVDALEKIADRTPALVFMDIQMPRMNGYETTERLRERGAAFPIIAVTASALSDEREHCLKVGMNDVLVKPFKRPDIKGMLDKWIGYQADRKAAEPEVVEELTELEELEEFEELEELAAEEGRETDTSGSVESSAQPGLDDLNPRELLDTFFGKKDIVDSLLARFVERTAEQIANLPKLISAENWDTARREAHTIKGSAMNLQAKNLGRAAAALETAILEQDRDAMRTALPPVDGAFKIFAIAAKTFISTPGGDKKGD